MTFTRWMAVIGLCFSLSQRTYAVSVEFNFDSLDYFDETSTGVWNLVSQKLHVPFIVDRANNSTDEEDDTVAIGTGKDGAFSSANYDQFDQDTENSTLIVLDTSRIYEFTTFTLDAGFTLKGQGSDPLRIRVQGDTLIQGTIDVSGTDGSSVSSDLSTSPQGGQACCSGANGGAGGSSASSASAGSAADSGATGGGGAGQPSTTSPNGSGGGGGGGYETTPSAAAIGSTPAGGGAGGAAGSAYGDTVLSTLVGGSGGGGGGAYTLTPASAQSSGGAGGAGGGAVSIHCGATIEISSSGSILANGGDGGGASSATLTAGSGGGGAGGAILLFAAVQVKNDGTLNAIRGSGGSGSGGGDGGNGATGRVRYVDGTTVWISNGSGSESPFPNMADFGRVFRTQNSVTILSKAYDTQNSAPTYSSFSASETTPSSTSTSYEVQGSSDNFASDVTEFVTPANITNLNGKRYFRFRVTLQTTDRNQTPEVSQIVVEYTNNTQEVFQFEVTSCARVSSRHTASTAWGVFSSLFFLLYLICLPRLTALALRHHHRR